MNWHIHKNKMTSNEAFTLFFFFFFFKEKLKMRPARRRRVAAGGVAVAVAAEVEDVDGVVELIRSCGMENVVSLGEGGEHIVGWSMSHGGSDNLVDIDVTQWTNVLRRVNDISPQLQHYSLDVLLASPSRVASKYDIPETDLADALGAGDDTMTYNLLLFLVAKRN